MSRAVLDVDMDLRRLDIEPHVRHLSRSGQAKNVLIEFRAEHAPCPWGKAAFSTAELPKKSTMDRTERSRRSRQ